MAFFLSFNPPPSLASPFSSSSTTTLPIFATPLSRLQIKQIDLRPKPFNGVGVHASFTGSKRYAMTVKASSATDGPSPTDGGEPPSDTKDAAVPVNKLPLESKTQQLLEQKMKMKLAKKIRLRRKRLLRKRKMRKKGRWPPSKMRKLKNV